jgi:hypothetical protein
MTPIKLSQVKPDFISILEQLIAHKDKVALTNPQVWRDVMASGVGQTFLEAIAATTAFNQYAIESGFREAFHTTALRDSSKYAIARMLGVAIGRKQPAALGIKLLNTTTDVITIGRNSLFVVEGQRFFNREEIRLNVSSNFVTGKRIYEGYLKTKSLGEINSPGDKYLNEPGFFVSSYPGDLTLLVRDSVTGVDTVWTPAEGALYSYSSTARVYYTNTAGDGDVMFTFGDGTNGALPGISTETIVEYIMTLGSAVNQSVNSITGGAVNTRLGISYIPNDTGVRVEVDDTAYIQQGISGGTDEKSADYYCTYSAYLYRSKQHAVNTSEYMAIVLGLGGIASARIEAQRDIDPSRVDLMNTVYICALPTNSDILTAVEKAIHTQSLNKYIDACIRILFVDPVVVPIKLKVTLYIKPTYDLTVVKSSVKTAVSSFFAKKTDSLGKRVYLSDLISLVISVSGERKKENCNIR